MVTDGQVRKLMEEHSRSGKVEQSSLRAGMHRNTGRKYIESGKLPSEMKGSRAWRTRSDPFAEDWPAIVSRLKEAPELEAKALFEHLLEQKPESYHAGQLRTFQRRVREWRAQEGPDREVFFPQEHRAGEAMQTDFMWGTSLGVTIGGEPFQHMLCHPVLPYSNWEWATVCQSESMTALRRGVQTAVFRLGRVPEWHQTDNSTAATHDLRTGKRGFNEEYLALMRHLGMKPRTIGVGESHQNGDVEALNGALRRRLRQHLLLRESSDFESVAAYEEWIQETLKKANVLRSKRIEEELGAMRAVNVKRLPEHSEERVRVTSWSTVKVKRNVYSVPSRLIGETVTARVFDDRVEVWHGSSHQLTMARLQGEGGHRIDYRHIIWSLVRKPGAFPRYRYRQSLYPSLVFRRTYDRLVEILGSRKADIEYLRILHLAASTMQSDVETALELLLDDDALEPLADAVKGLVSQEQVEIPELEPYEVNLGEYDAMLGAEGRFAG